MTTSSMKRLSRGAAVTTLLLSLVVTPIVGQRRPPADTIRDFAGMVEVYESWVQRTAVNYPCTDSVAPAGNELHDCQRLVVFGDSEPGVAAEFGPLVGVYPFVGMLSTTTDYSVPQAVALVVNYGADAQYDPGEGRPAVTVRYAADDYPGLGITAPDTSGPSVHCLWLHDDAGRWEGSLVALDPGRVQCGEEPAQWDLDVQRDTYQNALIDAYPNTARWRWTHDHVLSPREEHFIGIKCGDGWCKVGQPGFNPFSLPQPAPSWTPARAIPGFYDAQFLAVMKADWTPPPPDDVGVGPFEPGPWGEIRPLRVPHGWDWGRPLEVAAIEVDPAFRGIDEYDRKLGLGQRGGLRMSRVVLENSLSGPPSEGSAGYLNRVTGAFRAAQGVIGSPALHGVSGSTRWRWRDDTDETVWVSCWQGCCEVEEGIF